jgi:hypothetical protein
MHGTDEECYKVLLVKSDKKRPLVRSRRRWEDTVKMDLREIRCEGIQCIKLVKDRVQWWGLVNTVMNPRVQ